MKVFISMYFFTFVYGLNLQGKLVGSEVDAYHDYSSGIRDGEGTGQRLNWRYLFRHLPGESEENNVKISVRTRRTTSTSSLRIQSHLRYGIACIERGYFRCFGTYPRSRNLPYQNFASETSWGQNLNKPTLHQTEISPVKTFSSPKLC